MFATRYFAPRFFAPRYWPKHGQRRALIRQAVAAMLAGDATVAGMVGTGVYYGAVDQSHDASTPAVTYQMISNRRPGALDGPDGTARARFQIGAVSRDALECESLMEACRQLFDGYTGTVELDSGDVDVDETLLSDERDAPWARDDGSGGLTYRMICDVMFLYREPIPSR